MKRSSANRLAKIVQPVQRKHVPRHPPPTPEAVTSYDASARVPDPSRPLRIVALYKTFCGPEFVAASLASIYPHVDAIVMVHSSVGWDGSKGNTVQAAAEAWSTANDSEGKVVHLVTGPELKDQTAQCNYGLQEALKRYDPDFFLLIDTDEVWDAHALIEAKRRLVDDHKHVRFTCRMCTYVKNPLYRVRPPERCQPTVFLRNVPGLAFHGPRCNKLSPVTHWSDVFFHHFTYVRETDDLVFAKIQTSTIGDGCKTKTLDVWRREHWDKIPFTLNLHTTIGEETSWARLIEITVGELPEQVRSHHLVRQTQLPFQPPISIIVPTCRSEAEVAALVAEINRRSTGEFEVIATCRQGSASHNRNVGLEAARYDVVIMIDDDIRDLTYGWNQRLARTLHIDSNVMVVSARLLKPDGQLGHLMGNAPVIAGQATVAAERKLATACVAFRKTNIRFDENFIGSGFEDDDYCYQLRQQNPAAKFVVDNAVLVTHLNEMKNQKGSYFEHNKRYITQKWKLP